MRGIGEFEKEGKRYKNEKVRKFALKTYIKFLIIGVDNLWKEMGEKNKVVEGKEIKEVLKEIFPLEILCDIIKKLLPMYSNCAQN